MITSRLAVRTLRNLNTKLLWESIFSTDKFQHIKLPTVKMPPFKFAKNKKFDIYYVHQSGFERSRTSSAMSELGKG